MTLYRDKNEFRLASGGCGCCKTTKTVSFDENNKLIPYDEDIHWNEPIMIKDIEEAEKELNEQIETLNKLKVLMNMS